MLVSKYLKSDPFGKFNEGIKYDLPFTEIHKPSRDKFSCKLNFLLALRVGCGI